MTEYLDILSVASNGLVDEPGGETVYFSVPGQGVEVELYAPGIEVEIHDQE